MSENNHPSAIEQSLLDLLANNLFGCSRSGSVCVQDWVGIWQEAYAQAVPLSVFTNGIPDSVPTDLSNHIKGKIGELVLAVSRRIGEHVFIHKLMSEADIPYTIIKGFACSFYYNDPLLRLIGDVDFLVDPQDEYRCVDFLLDKGFVEIKTTGESHRVFHYKGCRYELHTEPAGIPDGDAGDEVRKYLRDVVANSRVENTAFGQVSVPSEFHHGLIMLLHLAHHLNVEGVGLRHICDWAVFVSQLGQQKFTELFQDPLKDMGLWHFALILTKLSADYLGCVGWSLADDLAEVSDELLNDIFIGGNLGQKNDSRTHEGLVLSSEKQGNGYFKNLFESANRIVYKNWSFCKNFKILLPIGWLFFGLRYIFRSLQGKRPKIDLKEIKEGAVKRKSLYSRLHLFKMNEK